MKPLELDVSGSFGGGGGAGDIGGGRSASSRRTGFLDLGIVNRVRFLAKRSLTEVGKPVSTTREEVCFGD